MSNSRNKILVFAQSAIEGQNIQSQAEYEGSSEREDGVSTGIANGNNFNKLAKQVSTISSSIAEFIVNNTEDVVVGDTSSVEQISGYISQAISKLITENLPPKEPGINIIDSSSEITDFNQLTSTGVYYIYKDLLNKPYANKTNYVLTVLNLTEGSGMICIQLASSYVESNSTNIPAIVNDGYTTRYKQTGSFSSWSKTVALDLSTNKAVAVSREALKSEEVSKYMIISTDNEGNSIFKTASRELMRSALGINALGDKVDLQTDVENVLGIENINNYTNGILSEQDNILIEFNIDFIAQSSDLILKSGSTIYYPNGTSLNIDSDIHLSYDEAISIEDGDYYLFLKNKTKLVYYPINKVRSYDSIPSATQNIDIFLNYADKKMYSVVSSIEEIDLSLPIAILSATNSTLFFKTIFNTIGFLGGCLFVLPGIKVSSPNGIKNGLLNNSIFLTTQVLLSKNYTKDSDIYANNDSIIKIDSNTIDILCKDSFYLEVNKVFSVLDFILANAQYIFNRKENFIYTLDHTFQMQKSVLSVIGRVYTKLDTISNDRYFSSIDIYSTYNFLDYNKYADMLGISDIGKKNLKNMVLTNASISSSMLQSSSVTTSKIADNNITKDKIANSSVTDEKTNFNRLNITNGINGANNSSINFNASGINLNSPNGVSINNTPVGLKPTKQLQNGVWIVTEVSPDNTFFVQGFGSSSLVLSKPNVQYSFKENVPLPLFKISLPSNFNLTDTTTTINVCNINCLADKRYTFFTSYSYIDSDTKTLNISIIPTKTQAVTSVLGITLYYSYTIMGISDTK